MTVEQNRYRDRGLLGWFILLHLFDEKGPKSDMKTQRERNVDKTKMRETTISREKRIKG